jgi:hypothetical protein
VVTRADAAPVAQRVDSDPVDQRAQHRIGRAQLGHRLLELQALLGELGHERYGVVLSDSAAPSRAPRARSTEHEMQVKVGVSRSV